MCVKLLTWCGVHGARSVMVAATTLRLMGSERAVRPHSSPCPSGAFPQLCSPLQSPPLGGVPRPGPSCSPHLRKLGVVQGCLFTSFVPLPHPPPSFPTPPRPQEHRRMRRFSGLRESQGARGLRARGGVHPISSRRKGT